MEIVMVDYKNYREVGIALDQGLEAVKTRLGLMTAVFAASVFIGVGMLGWIINKVDKVQDGQGYLRESLARIEGKIDQTDSNSNNNFKKLKGTLKKQAARRPTVRLPPDLGAPRSAGVGYYPYEEIEKQLLEDLAATQGKLSPENKKLISEALGSAYKDAIANEYRRLFPADK